MPAPSPPAVLFYFDHSVSSQLAQTANFNLRKPSAYSYDFYLLGCMTLACGLLGIPPVNGVLPQVGQGALLLFAMQTLLAAPGPLARIPACPGLKARCPGGLCC